MRTLVAKRFISLIFFCLSWSSFAQDDLVVPNVKVCPDLVSIETLTSAEQAFLTGLSEDANVKIRKVLKIGKARDYDSEPLTEYLREKIQTGGTIRFAKGFWVSGSVRKKTGKLTIEISSMNYRVSFWNYLGVTVARQPKGVHQALTKSIYGIVEAASEYAAQNPQIKMIEIRGGLVINKGLKKWLSEWGFVSEKSGLPLTPGDIEGAGQDLVLRVKVNQSRDTELPSP